MTSDNFTKVGRNSVGDESLGTEPLARVTPCNRARMCFRRPSTELVGGSRRWGRGGERWRVIVSSAF